MLNGQENIYDNLFYRIGMTPYKFQDMCQKLFMAKSASFYKIEDSIGDDGCDGYDPKTHSFYAIYFPKRPRSNAIYQKVRRKISADLKKANNSPKKIKYWFFVTPFDPDKIIEEYTSKKQKQYGKLKIVLYGQTKLQELLNLYPHIKDEFLGEFGEITGTMNEIVDTSKKKLTNADMVYNLLLTAERNITEKLENSKIYLLRKNFDVYVRSMRELLRNLTEENETIMADILSHMQAFCVNLFVIAHKNRVLFGILNEEILQSHMKVADENQEKVFLSITNQLRAYVDVSITLNSMNGIGYLQQKNFTWWLMGALFLLGQKHHLGEIDMSKLKETDFFESLITQRINAKDIYIVNYNMIKNISKEKRPDLYNYLSKLHSIIEEKAKQLNDTINKKPPFYGIAKKPGDIMRKTRQAT